MGLAAGLAAASPAGASEQFGDRDVSFLLLKANDRGEALVTYRTSGRLIRHVYVWGAVNATRPDPGSRQVQFRYDYSGGSRKDGRQTWKAFQDRCRPYDGRGSPGSSPRARPRTAPTGRTYGGTWQGLFGRLTYLGQPVYGFRTPSSRERDSYARFFYVDTFNSVFGAGWRHDAGKVAHSRNGAFCYSFVPQMTPPGYPVREVRPPGNGERHRVTVMGPGVTPVLQWEGAALGRYDPKQDAFFNAVFDRIVGPDDRVCVPER